MNARSLTEANGLKLQRLLSEKITPTISDIPSAVAEHINLERDTYFVAYLDYRVAIGRYGQGGFSFYKEDPDDTIEPEYLQRLRVFNEKEELLIWRSGNGFKARLRRDGDEEGDDVVVDAQQVLFGTKKGAKSNEEFTEIVEDRGTSLILPLTGLRVDKDGKLDPRICVKTRNYVEYNDIGQATYTDCRFIGFDEVQYDSPNERRDA